MRRDYSHGFENLYGGWPHKVTAITSEQLHSILQSGSKQRTFRVGIRLPRSGRRVTVLAYLVDGSFIVDGALGSIPSPDTMARLATELKIFPQDVKVFFVVNRFISLN